MLTILTATQSALAFAPDELRGCIWYSQADGTFSSVSLSGDVATVHHTALSPVHGIGTNGRVLVLAHADGTVSTLNPDDPSGPITIVSKSNLALGQAVIGRSRTPSANIVARGRGSLDLPIRLPAAKLMRVELATGKSVNQSVDGLAGLATDGVELYVGLNKALPRVSEIALLRGSTLKTLATGLPAIGHLGISADGSRLLACHSSRQQLSVLQMSTGAVQYISTASIPGRLLQAAGLTGGRIALLTDAAVAVIDEVTDLEVKPSIGNLEPIFIGSWAEIEFELGTSGLSKEDVHFEVPEGPTAGFVSYTRQNGAGDPVPFLAVGGALGKHKLLLVENATSKVLAESEFEITNRWTNDDVGPPGCTMSAVSFEGSNGWGGGPNTPQNMSTSPHTGIWRTMVVMVDTSSARWPSDAATMSTNRNNILGHITNGVVFEGKTRSVRQYYEENSNYKPAAGGSPATGLTISVHNNQAYGPIALPDAWTDYFAQKKDKDGVVTDTRWSSKGTTVQNIINLMISSGAATNADFRSVDALIFIPFSPDATGDKDSGARFVWPHANDNLTYLCGLNAATDQCVLGFVFAPLDFDVHDGRQMHTTVAHELGHTLGLPDLYDFPIYPDDITNRLTSDWDMMAGSRNTLPHFTLSNKMRMGWIPADQLRLLNFLGSSTVTGDVTLQAAELGVPPAGRVRGIEVRLGNGWNYYVEYRAQQATIVSDTLPTDQRVLITDVTSDSYTPPIARPPIVFVRNDLDGDGPILPVAGDYEERDPGTMFDLKIEVTSAAQDHAVVQVTYGSNGKPEPGIRPWNGAASNWRSPDIEIRNDKTVADPSRYFDTPWAGHDNIVVAKVKNSGDLNATGVVVDFFVTEFSVGDGPWVPLGFDKKDVPANSTVEFQANWTPPAEEDRHYCIIVRIRLYQDPTNLAIVDQNIYNNEARSNYVRFISSSASPSSRVGTTVLLANPFDESTLVHANVQQTHKLHRVFYDHQWLRVPGKESHPIRVWDESLWGTPEWFLVNGEQRSPSIVWEIPNNVSVTGWAVKPFESDCGAKVLTGGVGLRVDAGRATKIDMRTVKLNYVTGRVTFVDNGSPVTNGTVLIEVADGNGKNFVLTTEVDASGNFGMDFNNIFGALTKWINAHFLGAYAAAPCESGPRSPQP